MPVTPETLQEIFKLLIKLSSLALIEARATQMLLIVRHPELKPLLDEARAKVRGELKSLDSLDPPSAEDLLTLLQKFEGPIQ